MPSGSVDERFRRIGRCVAAACNALNCRRRFWDAAQRAIKRVGYRVAEAIHRNDLHLAATHDARGLRRCHGVGGSVLDEGRCRYHHNRGPVHAQNDFFAALTSQLRVVQSEMGC